MQCTVKCVDFELGLDFVIDFDEDETDDFSDRFDPGIYPFLSDHVKISIDSDKIKTETYMRVRPEDAKQFAYNIKRLFRENYGYEEMTDVRAELNDGRQYIVFEHDSMMIDVHLSLRLFVNNITLETEADIPNLIIEDIVDKLDIYRDGDYYD